MTSGGFEGFSGAGEGVGGPFWDGNGWYYSIRVGLGT